MTDDIQAVEDGAKRLSPEEMWKTAQKFHEAMASEIEQVGDMIGVCAIMFTNMLISGVMAGADDDFIGYMLNLVREDVENGIAHMRETMNTLQ